MREGVASGLVSSMVPRTVRWGVPGSPSQVWAGVAGAVVVVVEVTVLGPKVTCGCKIWCQLQRWELWRGEEREVS